VIGGLLGAVLALLAIWSPLMGLTANLPGTAGTGVRGVLIVLACLVGFLAGSAVARRGRRDREHLRLFSGVTGGVAGGIIGAAATLLVTGAYLIVYGHIPMDISDEVLAGLGLVAFTVVGFFLGAFVGSLVGALLGTALKFASPRH
jgi:hypothetical protein